MDGASGRTGVLIELSGVDGWKEHAPGTAYRCPVLVQEEHGHFTATPITLPGVQANGTTEQEALNNLAAALAITARRYAAAGQPIPWAQETGARPGDTLRWVFFYLPPEEASTSPITEGASADEPRIVKTPGVCGGDACIRNTRLTVWGLEEWRRQGWSDDKLLDNYPQLSPEDLTAAWAYVAGHREEIDRAIDENREA